MEIENGLVKGARILASDHCDSRPVHTTVSLLVIHNISLPPGQFGGHYVENFFLGKLDRHVHPFFETICQLRVSAHLLIKRSGSMVQFVPFDRRAWHAGQSSFQGVSRCNDYSIGIELEGTDDVPYTSEQYRALEDVTRALQAYYPAITMGRIVGHRDIAPMRKTDPGPAFDWCRFRQSLCI